MTDTDLHNDPAPVSPSPSSNWWVSPWFQGAVLAIVTMIGMLHYQFTPGWVTSPDGDKELRSTSVGLPGADGYYHIKMAYLYRTGEVQAAGENFHWTRESTWSDSFSDKDFLFHIYLVPFTFFAADAGDYDGLIRGAKFGTALLGTLLVLTLFTVLRRFGVRHAWVYVLCVVAVGGTYWVFRLNLCRSYLVSVTLAMAGWLLIAQGRRLALFLLAAVFTLAYTASHLLFAMLLVRAVMELVMGPAPGGSRKAELKRNGILGACILGGIALGCVLHPQSVELVKLWWVQNVVVLALSHQGSVAPVIDNISALFGSPTDYGNAVEISLGRELNATTGPNAIFGTPVIFFAPMFLPLLAAILGWRPTREAILTATIAVVWLCAYMVNGRFLEYAAPFMVLAVGVWLTGLMQSRGYRNWMERRPVASRALPISAAIVAVIAGVSIWVGAALSYRVQDRGDIIQAGRWLHENEEAHGKLVWHDRWDDFTQLMFYASESDYLVGLDPTFFLAKDRQRYETWYDIRRGRKRNFLPTIRDDFKADYILAHRSSSEFFYNRLSEEAHAGRLELKVRAPDDSWSLYEIVKDPRGRG